MRVGGRVYHQRAGPGGVGRQQVDEAIEALGLPAVEVHLSDISKREPFRRASVIKPVCLAQFKGEGPTSYFKAIDYCLGLKNKKSE